MKVLKSGKEVKDATVVYDHVGNPSLVRIKGDVNDYDASAFTFEDDKPVKKTRKAPASRKK